MAKKDVNLYTLQVYAEFLKYKEIIKNIEDEINLDNMSEEDYNRMNSIILEMNKIKNVYEIISYCNYLLELPQKKKNKSKVQESLFSSYEEYFKSLGLDIKSLRDENESHLKELKNYINTYGKEKFYGNE